MTPAVLDMLLALLCLSFGGGFGYWIGRAHGEGDDKVYTKGWLDGRADTLEDYKIGVPVPGGTDHLIGSRGVS